MPDLARRATRRDDAAMKHGALPETRYVKTDDGVYIGYQVFGEGPYDLVLNDGWMGNVDANWDLPMYARFLAKLGKRARVVMFDRRGFGISDRPSSLESMSLEMGLDDMRTVMDAAGCERAVVYGFEDGCAVSLLFAASYPERTRALILATPLVTYFRTPDFPWGFTEDFAREWEEAIATRWGTVELWRWNMQELNGVSNDESTDEDLELWARWSRLAASPQAALAIEKVQREVDVRSLLPQILTPTLVLMKKGDRDGSWGAAPWVAEQIPGARFIEIPGQEHFFRAEDALFFEEVDALVSGVSEQEAVFDRVLATVLFTDIVDSTQRAVELGDRSWRDLLERHHATVRSVLARYRGTEIDTAGDGFFATFDGPARAVRAAQHIVVALRPLGLDVRAGVHTGEVQTIDGKVGGVGVIIGARVGALAGASEVFVSQTVKDLVAGSGLIFEDRGAHRIKGVPDEWRVFVATG
jgi:pimeloyl-ACP methyl ester carboxylesterase